VEVDIELGNIEEIDIGESAYDVIVATSVFEHVEQYNAGLRWIYRALKPGGVFYFCSTNKFSLTSGEYKFPLYGWLPDRWRYALRSRCQGDDIMRLGIDFNQFTYPQLRRVFERIGFSQVLDVVDLLDPDRLNNPAPWKRAVLQVLKHCSPLKHIVLTFRHVTMFICVK